MLAEVVEEAQTSIIPSLNPQSAIPLLNLLAEMTQQMNPDDPSTGESYLRLASPAPLANLCTNPLAQHNNPNPNRSRGSLLPVLHHG